MRPPGTLQDLILAKSWISLSISLRMSHSMLIKARWLSLSWHIVVHSLFWMNILLNSLWPSAPSTSIALSRHLEMYLQLSRPSTVCKGNEWGRLQTAQVWHQVFDPDHPCTQQPILLQLLWFHHSPAIPVYARNQQENRCSHMLSIVSQKQNELRNWSIPGRNFWTRNFSDSESVASSDHP